MPGAQRVPPSEEVPWLRARVAELDADNEVMAAQPAARDAQPEAVQATSAPSKPSSAPPAAAGAPPDGLADFAIVQSYLSTAAKWGIDALTQLFTDGPRLPTAIRPG